MFRNPEGDSCASVAEFLGRTVQSVRWKAWDLRKKGFFLPLMARTEWTEEKENFIKRNYSIKTYAEIGDCLGVSEEAVAQRARKILGLRKHRKNVTAEELEKIARLGAEGLTRKEIAIEMDMKFKTVSELMRVNGLKSKPGEIGGGFRKSIDDFWELKRQEIAYYKAKM